MAFSLSSGELAGLKFNHVEVASRRHISAKKRVGKSSDASFSINSSIDLRDISRRFLMNSFRFINKKFNRTGRIDRIKKNKIILFILSILFEFPAK